MAGTPLGFLNFRHQGNQERSSQPSANRNSGELKADGLAAHGQHDTKTCSSADHLIVGFRNFFQGIALDHGSNSAKQAELQRVLGILGATRGPPANRSAAENELY